MTAPGGEWTTPQIAKLYGWNPRFAATAYLRSLGLSPTGRSGASLLWDAREVADRLSQRPGSGSNLRRADLWPHGGGWRCKCPECMERKQRQRDALIARYRAERVWVVDHWEAPVPAEKHGLLATAKSRGCECERCRARYNRYQRAKPRRHRYRYRCRPPCAVDGCQAGARGRSGLCQKHLNRVG